MMQKTKPTYFRDTSLHFPPLQIHTSAQQVIRGECRSWRLYTVTIRFLRLTCNALGPLTLPRIEVPGSGFADVRSVQGVDLPLWACLALW
jgi:hypothetical protein